MGSKFYDLYDGGFMAISSLYDGESHGGLNV